MLISKLRQRHTLYIQSYSKKKKSGGEKKFSIYLPLGKFLPFVDLAALKIISRRLFSLSPVTQNQ